MLPEGVDPAGMAALQAIGAGAGPADAAAVAAPPGAAPAVEAWQVLAQNMPSEPAHQPIDMTLG